MFISIDHEMKSFVKPDFSLGLPKTDYTYSEASSHYKRDISPGVRTLPNMSRNIRKVSYLPFSSSSSAEYDVFASARRTQHTTRVDRKTKISIMWRIFSAIWIFISSSFSSVKTFLYGDSNVNQIYQLKTPPSRHQVAQSTSTSIIRRASWAFDSVVSTLYQGVLKLLLLDTWLLCRVRSLSGERRSKWPLALLLAALLLAGWYFMSPTSSVTAPVNHMISVVSDVPEALYSVLPTVPVETVKKVLLGILWAPCNVLLTIWNCCCSVGSLFLSLFSLLSLKTRSSEESPIRFSPPPAEYIASRTDHGGDSHSFSASLQSLEKLLLSEIAKIREDVDRQLSQQKFKLESSQIGEIHKMISEKDESLRSMIGEVVQEVNQINHKITTNRLEDKMSMEKLRSDQDILFAEMNEVKSDVKLALNKSDMFLYRLRVNGDDVRRKLSLLQMQLESLRQRVKSCCDKPLPVGYQKENIRAEIMNVLHTLPPQAYDDAGLRSWIRSVFVSQQDLNSSISRLSDNFKEELKRREAILLSTSKSEISARIAKFEYDHRATENYNVQTNVSFDEWQIRRIVENALSIYDADKTGMSDFALESQGGEVISTRCTETYQKRSPSLSLFGIPLWHPSNSPRTVIQPGMHPGDCWAFVGSQGYLVVRLSHRIYVRGFSYEHVAAELLPTGKIDSAPKNFSVWGLKEEVDKRPILLGHYQYLENSTSLQYFEVQATNVPAVQLIELRVTSNHGNINYTCLYRFRVHGKIA